MKRTRRAGKMPAYDMGGLIELIPTAIGMANPLAGSLASAMMQNINAPSMYDPKASMNNYRGFNAGGNIDQQLNPGAVQIKGNQGIDTNARNISGTPVRLTEDEVVTKNNSLGDAFVFSDSDSMINPQSGVTFAETVMPFEKSIGKAKKVTDKYNDIESKNTIKLNTKLIDRSMQLQEAMKTQDQQPPDLAMNKGGIIPGYAAGGYPKIPKYLVDTYGGNTGVDPIVPGWVQPGYFLDPTKPQATAALPARPTIPTSLVAPMDAGAERTGWIQPGNFTPEPKVNRPRTPGASNNNITTFGDVSYIALKGAELLGKGNLANQRPTTYNTRDYQVEKQIYNPSLDINRNNNAYRSATYNTNTGNANLDRALASTYYGQTLESNRTVSSDYRKMQAQSDTAIDQINLQSKNNINQINEQNRASQFNAQDALLTSIGTFGTVLQDFSNTRATNRMTIAMWNSMADKYKVNVDELRRIASNDPNRFQQMLIQYQK